MKLILLGCPDQTPEIVTQLEPVQVNPLQKIRSKSGFLEFEGAKKQTGSKFLLGQAEEGFTTLKLPGEQHG